VPADLGSASPFAALGLVAVTAYEGLRRPRPRSLGGACSSPARPAAVGSAATSIARAQGASVVALVSRPAHVDYVRSLGADEAIATAHGDMPHLAPESVDAVLDAVGGIAFGACLQALKAGGTLALVGAVVAATSTSTPGT
jgi:NADPH:quinone reductase-like Zn-dependent oxidoreductase